MRANHHPYWLTLAFLSAAALAPACSQDGLDEGSAGTDPSIEEAKRRPDLAHPAQDMATGHGDMAMHGGGDMATGGGWPPPNPPPSMCNQRHAGVTAIQVVVQIDEYHGLIHGRNGDHEIAYGTVINTPWVYAANLVDTSNVQLAMNVKSNIDPSGLPMEIPLSVGQRVEAEGEYIPAATANAHDAKGAAAVIHYTHSPCGYMTISGTVYK